MILFRHRYARFSGAAFITLALNACSSTPSDSNHEDVDARAAALSAAPTAQKPPQLAPGASAFGQPVLTHQVGPSGVSSRAVASAASVRTVAGEILVKLRSTQQAAALQQVGIAGVRALATPGAQALAQVLSRRGIARGEQVLPRASVDHLRRLVKLNQVADVDATLQELRSSPEVEYAEPNYRMSAVFTPNDTYYATSGSWGQTFRDLWGLQKLNASAAWDVSKGDGVVVAVIDSGVDFQHADLAANMWQNQGEIGTDASGRDKRFNLVDDDNNGYADDFRGYDFVSVPTPAGDTNPNDENGHGTHVAGTIAATANNGTGIVGVAPNARIMPVRGLDAAGNGNTDDLVRAIYYAANNGARVINASWGGVATSPIQSLTDAVNFAHDVKGAVFVAAAGNSGTNVGTAAAGFYPANIRNVVTVAATTFLDAAASFSNFGFKLDVSAPGGGDSSPDAIFDPARSILSLRASGASADFTANGALTVGGNYVRQAGTSMAAPHVAGLAALIRSKYPAFTAEQVRQAIRGGVDEVGSVGFDLQTGYGRINAAKSLAIAAPLSVQLNTVPAVLTGVASLGLSGAVSGAGLTSWRLEYGLGEAPFSWTQLTSGTATLNGAITAWDTSTKNDGPYTLRLVATNASGQTFEDRAQVKVDNLVITSPEPSARGWRNGGPINVVGTLASPTLHHYEVQIFRDPSFEFVSGANVVLANGGTQRVTNGTLATWNPAGLPAGQYRIRLLVAPTTETAFVEETTVVVDPLLRSGWPLQPNSLSLGGNSYLGMDAQLTAADVDGDGDLEIPVAAGTQVGLYHHTGAAVSGWPRTVASDPLNGAAWGVAVGDVTGDSKPELVFGTREKLFVVNANGTDVPGFPATVAPWPPAIIVLADLNADSKSEIIGVSGSELSVRAVTGTLPAWRKSVTGSGWGYPSVGDIDRDGTPEIVVTEGSTIVHVFDAAGAEKAGWPRTLPTVESQPHELVLADIDGDQDLEIVYSNVDGSLHVLQPNGVTLPGFPRQLGGSLNHPAVGDIDADGRAEIVVGGYSTVQDNAFSTKLFALRADGTSPSGWPVTVQLGSQPWLFFGLGAPTLADVDGDGRTDVVVSTDSDSTLALRALTAFKGDGTQVSGFPRSTPDAASGGGMTAVVADFDNNGKADLLWREFSGRLGLYDLNSNVGPSPWPMYQVDAAHRGALAPAAAPTLTALPRTGWVASASLSTATAGSAIDADLASRWASGAAQANGQWFQVDMLSARTFSRVTLDAGTSVNDYPRGYQAFVSSDGNTWTSVATGSGSGKLVTINFAQQTARYVRIVQTAAATSWWSLHDLNVYGQVTSTPTALPRTGWVASASLGNASAGLVLDNVASSRWTSGAPQANGQWFQVDMGSAKTFTQVELDATASANDFPRGYQLFVSSDGTAWGNAIATGAGSAKVTATFPQVTARYVRIVQTGTATSWWSIHELNVLGTTPPAPIALSRTGWAATASHGTASASNAIDANPGTRYTSGAVQANGQWFQLDMLSTRSFSQLTLDSTGSANDFGRAYQVFVSANGTSWGNAIATGAGASPITTITFPVQNARFVRVVQTASATSWWSMHEVNVWQ